MASGDEEWREGGVSKETSAESAAYETDEIEAADLKYLVENSCIWCDKVLPRYTVRILPPRYVQERDQHVRSGFVPRRLMCVECYSTLRKAHKKRLMRNPLAQKSPLVKEMVMEFLLK